MPSLQTRRHEEVAGPFGRRLAHDRRLDVDEARRLHLVADDRDELRPQFGCFAATRPGAGRASGSASAASRRRSPRRAGTGAAGSSRRPRARRPGSRPRPVGRFGLTFSGARAATSPVARRTNSFRMSCAAAAASGDRSGLTTSWLMPVESRRSMKTSPPWSRRRATQPASVWRSPTWPGRSSPAPRSRQAVTGSPPPRPATGNSSSFSPARRNVAPSARTITVTPAPSRPACVSWPFSERPA